MGPGLPDVKCTEPALPGGGGGGGAWLVVTSVPAGVVPGGAVPDGGKVSPEMGGYGPGLYVYPMPVWLELGPAVTIGGSSVSITAGNTTLLVR